MLRTRFALLAVAVAVASGAIAGACADEASTGQTANDGDAATGTVSAGICPGAAPRAGDSCLLPEGTTCAFGACGAPIAECRVGVWHYGGNPPPRPPCPGPEAPPDESSCPP